MLVYHPSKAGCYRTYKNGDKATNVCHLRKKCHGLLQGKISGYLFSNLPNLVVIGLLKVEIKRFYLPRDLNVITPSIPAT